MMAQPDQLIALQPQIALNFARRYLEKTHRLGEVGEPEHARAGLAAGFVPIGVGRVRLKVW